MREVHATYTLSLPFYLSLFDSCPFRVRRDANYGASSFAGIAGYETEYSTVGGITAPKKIKCRGTDGKLWPQLVKGESNMMKDGTK